MTNPHVIAIDPYLLCLPDPCLSAEQFERFVQSLLDWSETLVRPNVRVLVSDACRIGLITDGQYPLPHRLHQLYREFAIDVADPETVCRFVQSVLDRAPSLEDECGVGAILFDEDGTQVTPAFFMTRLQNASRAAFLETLVILSAWQHWGPEPTPQVAIASAVEEDLDAEHDELTVDAVVHDVQWRDPVNSSLPARIVQTFDVSVSHRDFLSGIDAFALWDGAKSEEGCRDAIERKVNEFIQNGTADAGDRRPFRLGPSFLERARFWSFGARRDYAMLLIESCARIVVGQPKQPVEPMREDSRPSAPQRQRAADSALAFRTHLTKKGPGFRLLLWETPTGEIEFANVGGKFELEIH